ncbi:hypothetical protein CFP56_030366 [Quercus suber]|uniref:Uncharacterized protein n=1 Tax=Quercus suber TaxID=58331 RepID=A0AAW0JNJ3_QUESU
MVVDRGGGCADNADVVRVFVVGDFVGSDALWIGDFLHWVFVDADCHHDFHVELLSSLLLHVTTHDELRKKDGRT